MKQINSTRPKAMDKETFMQQYILNRATCITNDMIEDTYKRLGLRLVCEAQCVWDGMQEHLGTL